MNKIKGKDWLILLLDVVIVNISYFGALVLRFYMASRLGATFVAEDYPTQFLKVAPFYTVFCIVVFYLLRLYCGVWRYAGVNDMHRIIAANLITVAFQLIITYAILPRRMPISYYVVGAMLQFVCISLTRFGYRLILVEKRLYHNRRKSGKNTLIIGAGESSRRVISDIERSMDLRPVCVLDARGSAYERMMDGIPVYGSLDQMEKVLIRYRIKCVFIADSLLQPETKRKIDNICRANRVELIDSGYSFYLDWDEINEIRREKDSEEKDRKTIPFSPPDISNLEINEVKDALESGWITTGPRTKLLERRLAAFIETGKNDVDTESNPDHWKNKVVALSSCTAAEELNLRLLGIREGDEVIVPAYTYTATASAAIHCGATVKFIDIQKDGNPLTHMPEMDYDALESAITPKTKAIIVVDLAGIPADYDRVFEIVQKKKNLFTPLEPNGKIAVDLASKIQNGLGRIAVVSDCAHGLGASIGDTFTGRIADFTSFSFHAVKNFTTAEGGAATWHLPQSVYDLGVTDKKIYKMFQLMSLHGQNKDALAKTKANAWEYDIVGPWYKCNMTDIMAAIGLKQLDRYPKMLSRRAEIIKKYDETCDELGLVHLIHYTGDIKSSGHLYLVRVPREDETTRNKVMEKLSDNGISTNVHYKPLPMMNAYKELGWDIKDFPNAYDYYHNLFTLPLHTLLTDEDIARVCNALKQSL